MPTRLKSQNKTFKKLFQDAQSKTYTFLVVTIILVILLFVLAIRPTILKIGEIQSQVEETKKTRNDLDAKLKILLTLDQKYREYEQVVTTFQESIPNKLDTAALTANISEIARINNLSLQNIQFSVNSLSSGSSSVLPPEFDSTKISLNIKANNHSDVTSFVKQLENYPRPMHVDKIGISSPAEQTGQKIGTDNRLTVTIDVYTIQFKKGE